MSGLVIDIYAAFLIRTIVNVCRNIMSSNWPIVQGKIIVCRMHEQFYGCHFAGLRYQYIGAGEIYEGTLKKPFVFKNIGEGYVRRFHAKDEIPIRVKPADPASSFPVTD